jgi:hypothetical protein
MRKNIIFAKRIVVYIETALKIEYYCLIDGEFD